MEVFMEIVYIKRIYEGISVKYETYKEIYDTSIKKFLNELCIENLSTFDGRINAVRIKHNIKSLVPLYVSNECLLIPTSSIRNYECVWINYYMIQSCDGNEIKMLDGSIIEVKERVMDRQIKTCEEIAF